MWGSAIRNRITQSLTIFIGFEAAAWIVSKLIPSSPGLNIFPLATVFGSSIFGAFLLFTWLHQRGGPLDSSSSTTSGAPAGVSKPVSRQASNLRLFPELPEAEIPEGSVFLAINSEPPQPGLSRRNGFFSDLHLTPPFHRRFEVPSQSWAHLIHLRRKVQGDAELVRRDRDPSEHPWHAILVEIAEAQENLPEKLKAVRKALNPGRWQTFVRRFRSPIQSLKLRGVIMVCSVNRLKDATWADTAGRLQDQLRRIGSYFGVRYPVYFLFTDAKSVPYFDEFVKNLRPEERQEPLAVIFSTSGQLAADQIGQQIEDWSQRLAARRVGLLARETSTETKHCIFEHSREWSKLAPRIAEFLETAVAPLRPNSCGPLLRCFSITEKVEPTDLTRMYTTTEDLFLEGFATRTLLPDRFRAYYPEQPLNIKVLTAALLVLLALFALPASSWWLNRRLLVDARSATVLTQGLATTTTSQRLLGLERLRGLFEDGENGQFWKRWTRNWGLYQGNHVKDVYFERFRAIVLNPVRTTVEAQLRRVSPERPTLSFETVDYRLRLYHAINGQCSPDQRWFEPTLDAVWRELPSRTPETDELAFKQIHFYASERVLGNPYPSFQSDGEVIQAAQRYLQALRGPDQLLAGIIEEIDHQKTAARLIDVLPNQSDQPILLAAHRRLMTGPEEVQAAYAAANISAIETRIRSSNLASGDPCGFSAMPGEAGAPSFQTIERVRASYIDAYASKWKSVISDARVVRFTPSEAADRLDALAQNQSPLLGVLAFVTKNTSTFAASSPSATPPAQAAGHNLPASTEPMNGIVQRFRPVHHVIPPEGLDSWINAVTEPYVKSLRALADAMREVERKPTDSSAREAAIKAADAASRAVDSIRDGFGNGAGEVGKEVDRLLREPIAYCRLKPREIPCAEWSAVFRKFPFTRQAMDVASEADLRRVFDPQSGSLSALTRDGLLTRPSPGQWAPGPVAGNLTLTEPLVRNLNRMAQLSDALFPGTQSKQVTVRVTPTSGLTADVKIGGAGPDGQSRFAWPGPDRSAGVVVMIGPATISYPGLWGLHEMVLNADRTSKSGRVILRKVQGRSGGEARLEIQDLEVSGVPEVSGLGCPAQASNR